MNNVANRHADQDGKVRLVAAALLWAGLLLVSWWWLADRGLNDLATGGAATLVSIGRISGLVASVLLLAQTLLMVRLPLLERAYGQDRLARLHRIVGFSSFNLMVLHIVTISWGYAGGSFGRTVGELWRLTVDYPGMLLAAAGTACLLMIVATSVRAARRRLRYESWHLLHLYAYLGVGLALPHQLWTGQQFTSSGSRTAFWWTAWGATAAAVLVWRIGRPVALNLRHRLRVVAVLAEGPGVWSVHMTGRHLDRLTADAGQFFLWRFLGRPGWTRANPYSLSAAPDGRSLRITVQSSGDGSAAVPALRPGARVIIEGPFGRLSHRARTRRKLAFVGAGVGVAPLRALAEGLPYSPGDAVYLERFTQQPLFTDEVERLRRNRGLEVVRLPGRRRGADSWLGDGHPAVDDLTALRGWVPDIAERDVYLCGPEPWADLVVRTLVAAGVPDDQIHLESFQW